MFCDFVRSVQVRNITHHCHSFSICPAGWGWRDNSNDMHTTKQHCPPTFTGTPPEHGPKSRCGALVAETPLRVEKMPCKASLRIPVLFSWRMAHLRFLRKQDGSSANSRTPQTQTPPPSASHDHFRFHRHHHQQQFHQIHPKAQFPTLISGFVACVCLAFET